MDITSICVMVLFLIQGLMAAKTVARFFNGLRTKKKSKYVREDDLKDYKRLEVEMFELNNRLQRMEGQNRNVALDAPREIIPETNIERVSRTQFRGPSPERRGPQ